LFHEKDKMAKKIKVLRIIARLNIGGPAIHTILLSEGLDKNYFETVILAGLPENDEGDMSYLAKERGLGLVIIPELGRRLNFGNDLVAFWKIFRCIDRENPDIIHTHTAKAGALGRSAAVVYKCLHHKAKIKLFHTFHGHVLHGYFNKAESRVFLWIERLLAKFTLRIIAVSESVKIELVKLRVAGPEKIINIPLGLELDNYFKIRRNGVAKRDEKTIAIIGRLVPVKNHRMFLDVAKRIKELLGGKVKFMIVGDGPLAHSLKSYASILEISNDVFFTGWVNDLTAVYAQADVVTLTSLNEGTPVALIEAHAAGCPCVATNVGGVADVVTNGKSGFLVEPQDIESFVASLQKLLYNSNLSRSMGEYGRETVRAKFSKERLFKEMEELYCRELFGEKSSR